MNLRRRLLYALITLAAVLAASVSGYRILGGPSVTFLNALYMAIITLAGVGYGEIIETGHNPALRIFNIFVVLVGVTLTVYVFSTVTAFLVEGEISDLFWRRKMLKRISELRHHFIVCGLGDTGRYAVVELQKTGTPYVVLESHEDNIAKFKEQHGDEYKEMLYVIGDATDEATLDQAQIEHARGMIAGLAADKDNLVVTVMARQNNTKMRIVARVSDVKFGERLMKAGANAVVSPNAIGGMRMASEVLRPHVVEFLDLMLKEHSRTLRIEEIEVPENSAWVGTALEALKLRSRHNLMALAVRNPSTDGTHGRFWPNPPDDFILQAGTVVVVMGDVSDVRKARQEATREKTNVLAAATRLGS